VDLTEGDIYDNCWNFLPNDFKNKYKWQGDIILEYMTEYRHKLFKNEQYIKELLE
jgi:hypothetical protein